ncbi:MAG: dipeptidyl aminopeptidase/acylaminoacyl peptidase [Pseudohongiellaceae bacterium]|jgi:dipeptidyl aminopeptidase/acylaminoacyl peptidase
MLLLPLAFLLGCTAALPMPVADTDPADAASAPLSAAQQPPEPTLAQIFNPPGLLGLRPASTAISADGRWVTYRWTDVIEEDEGDDDGHASEQSDDAVDDESKDDEAPELDWWLANTATGERRVLFTHDDDVSLRWAAEGALLLVQQGDWIDTLDVDGNGARQPLFEAQGGASLQAIAGQRLLLSARADLSLWLISLKDGSRQLLSEGWQRTSSRFEWEEAAGTVAFFAAPEDADEGADDGTDDGTAESSTAEESAGSSTQGKTDHGPQFVLVKIDGDTEFAASASAGDGAGTEDIDPSDAADSSSRRTLFPVTALSITSGPSTDLSPNGRFVSLTVVDRSSEHELIMADYLTEKVTAIPVRDSLAGDPASTVAVSIFDVDAGETFKPALDQAERYSLRRTSWSPDGSLLLLDRISEDYHVRQVLVVDPTARSTRLVFTERDDAWIGAPTVWSGWSQDSGSVLLTSERNGYNHLYRVDAQGGEPVALTHGSWEIDRVTTLARDPRLLLTSHGLEDPASMELQLVDSRNGNEQRLVGAMAWADRPQVSADGSTILYRYATLGRPWDLHAITVGDDLLADDAAVQLSDTVPEALGALELPAPELISYTNPDDGATVHAYLYKPQPFDPSQRYPAVMFIHGAGQLQQVRRSMSAYEVNMLFHHRLARQGFVVIDPDYRHSNGYGRDFRAAIHGHMGGKDLDDAVAGIDYLETLGYVDTDNVGIYGGSYGGFMVLMALFTQPEAFAAGAALRSVTDWRTYNHWYTNPRLGLPDEDAEAYELSSPIDHVEGLQNPLLLLHGLKDNNVFAQDSIRLMEKMIELGKDFEVMLYPSQGHGFTDPASWVDEYKRIERLFVRELQE